MSLILQYSPLIMVSFCTEIFWRPGDTNNFLIDGHCIFSRDFSVRDQSNSLYAIMRMVLCHKEHDDSKDHNLLLEVSFMLSEVNIMVVPSIIVKVGNLTEIQRLHPAIMKGVPYPPTGGYRGFCMNVIPSRDWEFVEAVRVQILNVSDKVVNVGSLLNFLVPHPPLTSPQGFSRDTTRLTRLADSSSNKSLEAMR